MWSRGPSLFWGVVLVVIGVLFLLANLDVNINWNVAWPLVLIGIGVWLVIARIGPGGGSADVDTAEPRDGLTRGRFELAVGSGRIAVRSAPLGDQLFRLHIEHSGTAPEVRMDRATGTVRISQRLDWFAGARRLRVQAQLSDAIPWDVSCSTGAIRGEFDVSSTSLGSFECKTGASQIGLTVSSPKGTVPVKVEGGALTVELLRPAGAPVRVLATGGAVQLRADGDRQEGIGPREWRSPGFDSASDRYDVTVQGGALSVRVGSR